MQSVMPFFVFVGQPLALPVEKSFSYGQNKNSLIYLKLRFANPTKIYQGGPNHEREGHK